MKQEVAWTNKGDVKAAVADISSQIKDKSAGVNLVMFFASSCYDFQELSTEIKKLFPSSEVVGCSTSGEVGPEGFTKDSIVLTTMADPKVAAKGILIQDGNKYPVAEEDRIINTMRSCGIAPGGRHPDSFAITFVNGLCNVEEILASLLYCVVDDEQFRVIGGSAGDDLKFECTYVSLNGEVTTNGGVFVFVKTSKKFTIVKENIFEPTGRKTIVTKINENGRVLYELNDRPAQSEYERIVGNQGTDFGTTSLMNPLGRVFGDNIYIASIASVNADKSFNLYCRVMPNTKIDIMRVGDVQSIMDETVRKIEEDVPKPGYIFLVNCILRTVQFGTSHDDKYLTKLYSEKFGKFAGYSSYGEQINRISSNQTLVVLAMEE